LIVANVLIAVLDSHSSKKHMLFLTIINGCRSKAIDK
jgi:hypothetical protein